MTRQSDVVTYRNVEKKIFDNNFSSYAVTPMTTGTSIWSISEIPQGATDTSRVGNKITLKKIYGYLSVQLPTDLLSHVSGTVASIVDSHTCVRILIFQWFENDASAPPTDVVLFQGAANTQLGLQSPPDRERYSQFWTLYDKTFWLHTYNPVWSDYISLKPKKPRLQFLTAQSGINKIYIKIWRGPTTQSTTLSVAATPIADINLRVSFTDL